MLRLWQGGKEYATGWMESVAKKMTGVLCDRRAPVKISDMVGCEASDAVWIGDRSRGKETS